MGRSALITGVTGQDGAYLARLLLAHGYEVYGTCRKGVLPPGGRLAALGIERDVSPVALDLSDGPGVLSAIERIRPDELYNFAGQSSVAHSFEHPVATGDADALGVARLLEALRQAAPDCRFFQASTAEMFGRAKEAPQTEETPFHPRSPYGVAKLYGHWITRNYREAHGLHASSGILFNHESPLRGLEFVTRKITSTLAQIRHGRTEPLELGNLDAMRDWGFAGDYVECMRRMVQAERPDDYVIATGRDRSVREFAGIAAAAAGFELIWEGEGTGEFARDRMTGQLVVRVSPAFYRPAEVERLVGDASRARERLGWTPETEFDALVQMMVESDLESLVAPDTTAGLTRA